MRRGARTCRMQAETGSGGPYWPPSPHPTSPSAVVILTNNELRSGKAVWEEKNRCSPNGTRRTKVSNERIRKREEAKSPNFLFAKGSAALSSAGWGSSVEPARESTKNASYSRNLIF